MTCLSGHVTPPYLYMSCMLLTLGCWTIQRQSAQWQPLTRDLRYTASTLPSPHNNFHHSYTDDPLNKSVEIAGKLAAPKTRAHSFPFYSARRLAGDVIADPVDGAHGVADARRDLLQEPGIKRVPVCSHAVTAGDCSERDHVAVRPLISLHAHRPALQSGFSAETTSKGESHPQ